MEGSKANLVAALLMAVLVVAGRAGADPSPAAKYLMTHQVSAMDAGLLRLGLHHTLSSRAFGGQYGVTGSVDASAAYDQDTNRILVLLRVGVSTDSALTPAGANRICREQLALARNLDGVNGGGKPFENAWTPDEYFVSRYATTSDRPESIRADVLAMIWFVVSVYDQASPGNGVSARCEGGLMSSEILSAQ